MKRRFRLYRRGKGGRYYIHDDATGRQESLHTNDHAKATRLFHAKSEASEQPAINLQIARAYDPEIPWKTRSQRKAKSDEADDDEAGTQARMTLVTRRGSSRSQ